MSNRPSYAAKRAAWKAVRIAAEDLGMTGDLFGNATFSVEWVEPKEIGGDKGEVRGFDENTIFLRNDLSPKEAVKTVFHESRHLQRLREGKISPLQARLSREDVEKEEHIADGRMLHLWRKHRDEFYSEPWFPDETDDPQS